jgi:hypothetical protein
MMMDNVQKVSNCTETEVFHPYYCNNLEMQTLHSACNETFHKETRYFHNIDYIGLFMIGGGGKFKNKLCYSLQVSLGLQVVQAGM